MSGTQLITRIDPELIGQPPPGPLEQLQRFGLPSGRG